MNFAFIVPREEVAKAGADFGHKPVGTGPFKLTSWPSGQQLVFERNPNYFFQNLPYLDKVTVKVGLDPSVAFLSLTRGEVDLLGDGIPPAQFLQVVRDPKYKANILSRSNVNTSYISLNTGVGPLKDVRVRQAVNMAINKAKVLRIINGRGLEAKGYLPPLMPGYDAAEVGYKYDPAAAKALLAILGLATYGDFYPTALSLGMARRAAIARAFAIQPAVLLLDEPFVSLDPAMAEQGRAVLTAAWSARRCAALLVTHDLAEAASLADRILLLSAGPAQVIQDVVVPDGRRRKGIAEGARVAADLLAALSPLRDGARGA